MGYHNQPLSGPVRCGAFAALAALAVLLPFLGKAFTIDDVTFLLQAKHVLVDPVHPTAFETVADGVRLRVSDALVTGPVMAYLLVPTILLGGAEWVAHATAAVLLVIALIATASLALRLGLSPGQAALAPLFVVASPAVLGMAATAMPDVPAMTFAVVGVERFFAWKQTRRWSTGASAALTLAVAALTRPHVLLVLGCVGLWLVADRSWGVRSSKSLPASLGKVVIPVLGSLVAIGLVVCATRDPASGATVATATLGRLDMEDVAFNLSSFFLHWVVAFPLGILWPLLRGQRFLKPRRTYLAFAIAIVLVLKGQYWLPDWRWAFLILLAVGHGLDVLADIIGDAWGRRDSVELFLGLWLLIAVAAAAYPHLPSKLLVPSAPAMGILLARRVTLQGTSRMGLGVISFALIAGLTLGLLVIRADAAHAEIGRKGGQVVAAEVKAGRTVWMDGAWGFQWYATAAGALPLTETPPFPMPGDVVVAGLQARLIRASASKRTLLYRCVFAKPGGRISTGGAGFFSNHAGPLPWRWGGGELGRIEVWRIDSPVTGFIK